MKLKKRGKRKKDEKTKDEQTEIGIVNPRIG